jgi:hypothetical protein
MPSNAPYSRVMTGCFSTAPRRSCRSSRKLVGNYRNNGREWRPTGEPEQVNVHDFLEPALPRAVPYGVDDLTNNVGWVSVGTDHDTASFAINAIRRWWTTMGRSDTAKPHD